MVRRARRDRAAAQTIVERILPRVRRAVLSLVGSNPAAEDLVQACIVAVLSSTGTYRGDASLETWANGIVFRVVMRQMKRQRRREAWVRLVEAEPEPTDGNEAFRQARLRRSLVHHLQRLSVEQHVTLVLRVLEGHSVAEVSTITGVGINTVRGRIRSALRALRHSIRQDQALVDELQGWIHEHISPST